MVKPGDWSNRGGAGAGRTVTMEALAQRLGGGPADLHVVGRRYGGKIPCYP